MPTASRNTTDAPTVDPRFAEIESLKVDYAAPADAPQYEGKSTNQIGAMRASISRKIGDLIAELSEVATEEDENGHDVVTGLPVIPWSPPAQGSTAKVSAEVRIENAKSDDELVSTMENLARKYARKSTSDEMRTRFVKRMESVAKVARTRSTLDVSKSGDVYTLTVKD